MGREIVYCWKCATRLQGADFDSGDAFRVGDKVSCRACVDELVADLSAEEQEAILSPKSPKSKKSSTSRIQAEPPPPEAPAMGRSTGIRTRPRTGTTGPVPRVRTGTTGPVPTVGGGGKSGTGVRKRVTASIPKVPPPPGEGEDGGEEGGGKPPMDEKKKKLLLIGGLGGGLLLLIVVLGLVVLLRKPEVKHKPVAEGPEIGAPKPVAATESPKEKEVKTLLKDAFDLVKDKPEELGLQLQKFNAAKTAAEGTTFATPIEEARDAVLAKLDKAVAAIGDQILPQYKNFEFKAVIEAYEKAKARHDVPEWRERIDKKIELTKKAMEDAFFKFKQAVQNARQAGEEPKLQDYKDAIAKWEAPEFVEKWDKFAAEFAAADPEPGKTPDAPPRNPGTPAVKPLSPAMLAFMPAWQAALGPAMNRD